MPIIKIPTKPARVLSYAIEMLKEHVIQKAYPQIPFPDYNDFVEKVRRTKERSIYASASEMYYAAFFGRDSIEAAEDLLKKDPSFTKELIPLLASHQGTQYNLITEEEPGRIHHEYRMSPQMYYETTGEQLPKKVADIYQTLSQKWGGTNRELTYYGSVDATPLYIKLIGKYVEQTHDTSLLSEKYIDKDGHEKTIEQSALDALEWLTTRIQHGPREDVISLVKPQQTQPRIPLLEYQPYTEEGIPNQMWKDSQTAVIHEDGKLPNRKYPIATVELQGHAYDAILYAIELLKGKYPEKITAWENLADEIRRILVTHFWIPKKAYFAMAIDRDSQGNYRLVKTPTSDQTELLNTRIFDTISAKQKEKYVRGIITCVYSKNFMTSVGIRCRSLAFDRLVDFWDYHGSRAVWIKATYDFAKGLDRQGFYHLSDQLKIRILNGTRVSGNFVELFYVSPNGKVAYDPLGQRRMKHYEEIAATTIPEALQTWTASAVAAIEYDFSTPAHAIPQKPWQQKLEEKVTRGLPIARLITTPRKAYKARPKDYGYRINLEKGKKSEEEFTKTHASAT